MRLKIAQLLDLRRLSQMVIISSKSRKMNKFFRYTFILIFLFTIAVGYYFYIWIIFEPEVPLVGNKGELASIIIKEPT